MCRELGEALYMKSIISFIIHKIGITCIFIFILHMWRIKDKPVANTKCSLPNEMDWRGGLLKDLDENT